MSTIRRLVFTALAAGVATGAYARPSAAQSPAAPIAAAPPVASPPVAPGLGTGAARPGARPPEQQGRRLAGYLGPDGVPDSRAILPPAPAAGSEAQALDRDIYLQTRKLEGGPRWALAAQDAREAPAAVEAAFSCAVGVELTPAATPALLHLMSRLVGDAVVIVNRAKSYYRRPRPFIGNDLPICVERTDALKASPSYPSGHSTYGWAVGLVLAEAVPDRATPILARARAFGESRAVCGVHYASDVEEGRTNGAVLVAALESNAEFQADLQAVRLELAGLRRSQPSLAGAQCKVSDEAAAHTPWAQ